MYPQPTDTDLAGIYNADYFLGGNSPEAQQKRSDMKRATARLYLQQLFAYRGEQGGKLLEVGCGQGEFLVEAELAGYDVTGIELSEHAAQTAQSRLKNGHIITGEIETGGIASGSFDVVINTDVIEHTRNPVDFLNAIARVLKPDGVLMLVTISLDTWTARLLRHRWMEYKTEHLFYFSDKSLQEMMRNAGFQQVRLKPTYKVLSPKYIAQHFERYPIPLITPIITGSFRLLPSALKQRNLKLTGSGVTVMSRSIQKSSTTTNIVEKPNNVV